MRAGTPPASPSATATRRGGHGHTGNQGLQRQPGPLPEERPVLPALLRAVPGFIARERIATAHSRQGRDISPHLYDPWLECLPRAVQEDDPQYCSEVEASWRFMMGAGIGFLKSRYEGPAPQPA
jgi:hypothetical protein